MFELRTDNVFYVDETVAMKMIDKFCPEYEKCESLCDLIEMYKAGNVKIDSSVYIPLFVVKQLTDENVCTQYVQLVSACKCTLDENDRLFIGVDFSEYENHQSGIEKAVKYCRDIDEYIYTADKAEYIFKVHIQSKRITSDEINFLLRYEKGKIIAYVVYVEIKAELMECNVKYRKIDVPDAISEKVLSCIQNEFSKAAEVYLAADDRVYLNDVFVLSVCEKYLSISDECKRRHCFNNMEYIHFGEKSAYTAFDKLLNYFYNKLNDKEKKLFPYSE